MKYTPVMGKAEIVRCDVCCKIIKTREFRSVLIYVKYKGSPVSGPEKELDVCKSCIEHLNFRKYTKAEKKHLFGKPRNASNI